MVCPDRKGLVADVASFISAHGGNITDADHHTDFTENLFLSRIEWELEDFSLSLDETSKKLAEALKVPNQAVSRCDGASFETNWIRVNQASEKVPTAIWVSKQDHCLMDLLMKIRDNEIPAECRMIMGNHPELEHAVRHVNIPFHFVDIKKLGKKEAEKVQLKLLKQYDVELLVLAKYMQILSPDFLKNFANVINIHHSFLPAFVGAKPYHQAYERGVKLIGATSHFVTTDLDEGPIIAQEVTGVSHRDSISDLVAKGKDLERTALSKAVLKYCQRRILVFRNKTVVFDN